MHQIPKLSTEKQCALAQDQRDGAEDLRALAERPADHLDIAGRGMDRSPSQRVAQGVEQDVALSAEVAAPLTAARFAEVAQRRHRRADRLARVADRAPAAGIALEGPGYDIADRQ